MKLSKLQRTIFCVLAFVGSSAAQETTDTTATGASAADTAPTVTASEPSSPPPVEPTREVASASVISSFDGRPILPSEPLLRMGSISLRPRLFYRLIYADGIQSQPGQSDETLIHEISPGILIALGNRWTLDYSPTMSFYSSSQFRDTLGQSVRLDGNASYNNWLFGLSQSYSLSSDPLVETGTQTDQEVYSTALSASYQFNDQMWLDLGIYQDFRFAEPARDSFGTNDIDSVIEPEDSREWSTLDWLNYEFFPGFDAGIGAGFGYVDVETGLDMTYEQLQGRTRWRAKGKIFLSLNGGVEYRQFLDSNEDAIVNPIFGATIEYHPFEQTVISLEGSGRVSASYFTNEIIESAAVQVNLNQRLLEKFILNLNCGYSKTRFVSSSKMSNRQDEGSTYGVRINYPVRRRITLAAFYSRNKNTSAQSEFAFSSSQIGLEVRYQY